MLQRDFAVVEKGTQKCLGNKSEQLALILRRFRESSPHPDLQPGNRIRERANSHTQQHTGSGFGFSRFPALKSW